jgi:hypothetical protein
MISTKKKNNICKHLEFYSWKAPGVIIFFCNPCHVFQIMFESIFLQHSHELSDPGREELSNERLLFLHGYLVVPNIRVGV